MASLTAQQERDHRAGTIGTILFHAVLLILFLLFGLKQPNPLPYDSVGVELDFGNDAAGSGSTATPGPVGPDPGGATAPAPATDSPEEVATEEESPVVQPKPEKPKPKPTPEPTKPKDPKPSQPTIDPRLQELLNAPWGGGGDKGQGDENKPGDKGAPDGTPGALGSMRGEGWEIRGGRGALRGPDLSERPPLSNPAWVEVAVKVDRAGNVVGQPAVSGASVVDNELYNVAKRAVKSMAFAPNPSGPPEQVQYVKIFFRPG